MSNMRRLFDSHCINIPDELCIVCRLPLRSEFVEIRIGQTKRYTCGRACWVEWCTEPEPIAPPNVEKDTHKTGFERYSMSAPLMTIPPTKPLTPRDMAKSL